MTDNWWFTVCTVVLLVMQAVIGYLERLGLPKVEKAESKEMSIDEALAMMDQAVEEGHLYGAPSEVYPGLTAIQAIRFVLEMFLKSFPQEPSKRVGMKVHPRVEVRIRQVSINKILKGEPGPDHSIAAMYFLSHPEDRSEASAKFWEGKPRPITEEPKEEELPPKLTGKRKFL